MIPCGRWSPSFVDNFVNDRAPSRNLVASITPCDQVAYFLSIAELHLFAPISCGLHFHMFLGSPIREVGQIAWLVCKLFPTETTQNNSAELEEGYLCTGPFLTFCRPPSSEPQHWNPVKLTLFHQQMASWAWCDVDQIDLKVPAPVVRRLR